MHLLAKLHQLQYTVENVDHYQNHPLGRLDKHVDFMGEALDKLGRFINELNNCMNTQDVQIEQLANMVNNLVRKVEVKSLKANREEHCKVINTLMVKVITLEQCVEDVQRKAFPQVVRTLPNCRLLVDTFSSL
jgi:predicted RNase H-like nuclease (RuvC/YqgF family)